MSLSRTQIVNWLTRCGDIFSTERGILLDWIARLATLTTG